MKILVIAVEEKPQENEEQIARVREESDQLATRLDDIHLCADPAVRSLLGHISSQKLKNELGIRTVGKLQFKIQKIQYQEKGYHKQRLELKYKGDTEDEKAQVKSLLKDQIPQTLQCRADPQFYQESRSSWI